MPVPAVSPFTHMLECPVEQGRRRRLAAMTGAAAQGSAPSLPHASRVYQVPQPSGVASSDRHPPRW